MISTVEEERIYWQRRTDALLAQLERDEERLYEKLWKVYDKEAAKLERDIAAYYQRFGVDGVIEYRRLLESISPEDERLLYEKMDEFAAKYPQYAHLMPIRATIYKLNEMEAIQYGIRLQQLEIGAIEQEAVEAHLTKYARKAANLAAEQDGHGADFYTYDSDIVKLTVNSAWADGEHFSERIWGNRENLAKYLNDDFGKLIARGVNYEKCVSDLRKKYENTSRKNVKRLVFTEGTLIFNEAQARAHEGTYEYYSLSTCADKKVCEVCADIERRSKETPIRFSERAPGVNFPPLHPWCRCCYTVAVTDWDTWIDEYVANHGGDAVTPSRGRSFTSIDADGTNISFEADIDQLTVDEIAKTVENFKRDYPQAKDYIRDVKLAYEAGYEIGSNIAMVPFAEPNMIILGNDFLRTHASLTSMLELAKLKGNIVENTVEGVINHELGHILCDVAADSLKRQGLARYQNGTYVAESVVSRAFSKWKRLNPDVSETSEDGFLRTISKYAADNADEAVAEAFSAVRTYGMDVYSESSPERLVYDELHTLLEWRKKR